MKLDELGKPEAFWERPEVEQAGESTADAIHVAVGRALSGWEGFESVAVDLFLTLLGSPMNAAAKRAYGAISSASGRIAAMRGAFEEVIESHKISPEDVKRFNRFLQHYQHGGYRRNDIAHGMTMEFQFLDKPSEFYLVPPGYDSTKNRPGPMRWPKEGEGDDPYRGFQWHYRWSATEISQFSSRFGTLFSVALELKVHLLRTYHLY